MSCQQPVSKTGLTGSQSVYTVTQDICTRLLGLLYTSVYQSYNKSCYTDCCLSFVSTRLEAVENIL